MTENNIYDIINKSGVDDNLTKRDLDILIGYSMSEDFVLENLGSLNTEYKYLYKSYGFEDFHSFYLFSRSNEEIVHKGGDKDLSKLKKVTRKVMRNGKMIDMTVYTDDEKEDNEIDNKPKEEEQNTVQRVRSNGDLDSKVNTGKLSNSISQLKSYGVFIPQDFGKSNIFREFIGENNKLIGMASIDIDKDTVILNGFVAIDESEGIGLKSLFEAIKLAIENDFNLQVYDTQIKEAVALLELLGFNKNSKGYFMPKKGIKKLIGDFDELI